MHEMIRGLNVLDLERVNIVAKKRLLVERHMAWRVTMKRTQPPVSLVVDGALPEVWQLAEQADVDQARMREQLVKQSDHF